MSLRRTCPQQWARYYDPATGRFNRLDPFAGNSQDPQTLHKYLYAHANPVMNIDPTGLFSLIGIGAAGSIRSALTANYNAAFTGATTAFDALQRGVDAREATVQFIVDEILAPVDLAVGLVSAALNLIGSGASYVLQSSGQITEDQGAQVGI